MKTVLAAILLACAAGLYLVYFMVSTASHDPAVWHVDPLTAPASPTPNDYRVAPEGMSDQRVDRIAPVYAAEADVMAKAWDDFVMRQRDVTRIAGLPAELFLTYVQRSEVWKFPDYVSVKFISLTDGKSTVAVYSRSRYGHGDMGVNKARVERWLAALASFEAGQT